MNRFDLLKQADIRLAAELMVDLVNKCGDAETLQNHLEAEVTEEELQQINAAALKEGRQPLSFSFKQ